MVGAGALALSIVNMYMQIRNNKVKLRIVPMIGYYDDQVRQWAISGIPFPDIMNAIKENQHRLCVEVTNLSSFAITIRKLGFGKFHLLTDSIIVVSPIVMNRSNCWPLKLEPRESDILMLDTGINIPVADLNKKCAYAVTECGHIASGTSDVFNSYVELLKKQKQ